ncbi:hypothetical protein TorRG33x02_338590 [Trema orientale]|uniref:Uncharacterized protein n=1 Tax=Trema orientale TaxID=63057 RepID=A0A2P5AXH4_TREOI|nr:hypothetical protein TorRG33x02_338590 [Trema orientale]
MRKQKTIEEKEEEEDSYNQYQDLDMSANSESWRPSWGRRSSALDRRKKRLYDWEWRLRESSLRRDERTRKRGFWGLDWSL